MLHSENRIAKRIPCRLPLLLEPQGKAWEAWIIDISRTGLQIEVPGERLGIHRLTTLAKVAEALHQKLGDRIHAHLHHEMLGPLVSRHLDIMRIVARDWQSSAARIGCVMSDPLTDQEAGMMGLALPAIGAEEATEELISCEGPHVRRNPVIEADRERASAPPTSTAANAEAQPAEAAKHETVPYGASLLPPGGSDAAPVRGTVVEITRFGLRLHVAAVADLHLPDAPQSVTGVVIGLDQVYGENLRLKVTKGARAVWSGPAEVVDVAMPPERPGQVYLDLRFDGHLRPEERRAMALE